MPETVTQTTVSDLPAWMRDPLIRTFRTGEQLTQEPYLAYSGPRIADFGPQQMAGFQQASQFSQAAEPSFGLANLMATQAGRGVHELAGQYMNPFMQQAIDPAAREVERRYSGEMNRLGGQAAMNRAFGGSRQAILEGTTQRNFMEEIGNLYAGGRAAAYDRGITAALQDQARRGQLAGTFGQLGTQRQAAGLAGADALLRSGAIQQGLGQQRLDLGYEDFLNQRNWPYSQLSFMQSLIRGVPQIGTTQTATTQPEPNQFAQLVGAGIGGLGLASRFV